jgi:hypothetical protein
MKCLENVNARDPSRRERYDGHHFPGQHTSKAIPLDTTYHTVPPGRGARGCVFQAFHARLLSFSPCGTKITYSLALIR